MELHRIPRQPETMPNGLPQWACLALDAAIGSGTIRWDSLDGLGTEELLDVAKLVVARQLQPVGVREIVQLVGGVVK
jgi:hypothetical protein